MRSSNQYTLSAIDVSGLKILFTFLRKHVFHMPKTYEFKG